MSFCHLQKLELTIRAKHQVLSSPLFAGLFRIIRAYFEFQTKTMCILNYYFNVLK